jgi:sugar phosphate isomerase/epimerase
MPLAPGGCTYSYLWTLSLDDAVNRLADLGFRSIELMATPPHLWPAEFARSERAALRRLCASRGMTITSVNPTYLDLNLASLNPGFRAETVRSSRIIRRPTTSGRGGVTWPGGTAPGARTWSPLASRPGGT